MNSLTIKKQKNNPKFFRKDETMNDYTIEQQKAEIFSRPWQGVNYFEEIRIVLTKLSEFFSVSFARDTPCCYQLIVGLSFFIRRILIITGEKNIQLEKDQEINDLWREIKINFQKVLDSAIKDHLVTNMDDHFCIGKYLLSIKYYGLVLGESSAEEAVSKTTTTRLLTDKIRVRKLAPILLKEAGFLMKLKNDDYWPAEVLPIVDIISRLYENAGKNNLVPYGSLLLFFLAELSQSIYLRCLNLYSGVNEGKIIAAIAMIRYELVKVVRCYCEMADPRVLPPEKINNYQIPGSYLRTQLGDG